MPEFENLLTNLEDGIMTITINREAKLNALNLKTLEELRGVLLNVYNSKDIKAAIITGSGSKAFVAGADITEFTASTEQEGRKFAENGQQLFQMIEDCPKPIIAAVNGFALGGGCELAMACHLRVATNSAKFGQPEVNLGIIPGYGGTQRLTQLVGKAKALELMLTGDFMTSQQAMAHGLVNYLVDSPEEAVTRSREILSKVLTKAPLAVGMVIQSVNAALDPAKQGYVVEASNFGKCFTTDDFTEGTSAFLEKRQPNFQGK